MSNNCVKENQFQDFFEASNMAGRAINISKTTSPHAFSYAFTSKYFIPHGQAVWLTLPKIFEIHKNAYKVLLKIDSSESFYGGDRMRQGLSFEVKKGIYYRRS